MYPGFPNIYIYLDSSGNLVINEYSAFPDMSTTLHVRLATVTTSNGNVDSITDSRTGNDVVLPFAAGGIKKTKKHIYPMIR